jgi:UDP-2,3-diacylglucosamine pyrophosphatase LpxH
MAFDASKRDEDTYQPVQEIDLLLLGDIFDLLRTTQWNQETAGEAGFARPWSDPDQPALATKVEHIVDSICLQNAESLALLRKFADGTGISLPPPTRHGRVDGRVSQDRRSKKRLPVRVNIHYMNGNHDWFFHLPGPNFDRIRQKVIQQMGLCNPPGPFPHQPSESWLIQSILSQHNVFARHGDIYDPFNFVRNKGRDFSCLGDALLVELFNQLPLKIEAELGDKLPAELYKELPEMGSVRPGIMTPVWIAGLLERHQVEKKYRDEITRIWKLSIDHFLKLDFLKELDQPGFDVVDTMQLLLKLLRAVPLHKLDDLAPTAEKLINLHSALWGNGEFGFDENASKETAFQSGEAQFIVYGHTHGFKVVPLRTKLKNERPFDQMYINSGTWHPLHELVRVIPKNRSFIMYKTMSYLGFYRSSERKGRLFETWSGTLDV